MASETQAAAPTGKTLKVTLVRSPIGYEKRQKETVLALGLHRMHQTVEKADTAEIRGMIHSVRHLLKVSE